MGKKVFKVNTLLRDFALELCQDTSSLLLEAVEGGDLKLLE